MTTLIINADARRLPLADGSVDAIVTDPPYAEINRDYGRWTEDAWAGLMRAVVGECRRVLKPKGSAVFILQPNSERVGRMRPWLWDFMAWTAREWNQVQDAWWWNHATPPTVHCHEANGLMRPSMKACVWLGDPDCYRCQDRVLLQIADATMADKRLDRHELSVSPSGLSTRHERILKTCRNRGGATPFNVVVASNTDSQASSGVYGHGAGTPESVALWWIRYICPPGGIVLDPFCGLGTMGVAASTLDRQFVGVEMSSEYCRMARRRIDRPHRSERARKDDGEPLPLKGLS